MKITNALGRFAAEVRRAIANFKYEVMPDGRILLPRARASLGGVFRHGMVAADGSLYDVAIDPNRVVNEGLNYLLNAALGGVAPTTAFYLAPFSGNVTPASGWTGANFAASATEFTAYSAGTRLPWTTVPSTAQAIGNSAALAAATMTLNAGGPYNLYGVGLLEASAKGSTSGRLIAATRFANPRLNMSGGDKLALEYVLSAKDEEDV